ncbi:MAG TPA: sigma-54 dependent transcriptional regulator [Phycisphaerae bacterium]|nr:sigma-54 dependent transcriptional regulator [Phycisphaerae bacterium]
MPENSEEKPAARPVRILLVDDDQIILDSLGGFLEMEGYEVTKADNIAQAINCLDAASCNLVITDVSMPTSSGFELLRHVRTHHHDVIVIMVTGYGTIESAVDAIKQGAYDYLTKPIIDDDVRMAVRRALQQQQLLAENRQLKQALSDRYNFANIVGTDFRMAKVFDLVEAVADSQSTVLITGESGTGKSLVARAVHAHSPRRSGPFVEVACGALPDTLLESELFGHVRGAFTDAVADKPGKFAAADGGTIFLDEVATASPQLQVKLLRVLQDRQFEPVGSNETREADVRVVLATNRDLQAAVREGRFREDLYYRINVVSIELPPLRERIGDIPLLAEHFLAKYLERSKKKIDGFSSEAMELMQRHRWPGNVRELENCVERAVVLCRKSTIAPDDLPPAVLEGAGRSAEIAFSTDRPMTLEAALTGPERQIIAAALNANNGSRQAAARQLGINRTTLYKKMKKYGLLD